MFRPDQAQRLRSALGNGLPLTEFEGQTLMTLPIVLPSRRDSIGERQIVAGDLYTATRIFGTPYDSTCLDGIGQWPVHAPEPILTELHDARVIGPQTVLSQEGYLYRPDLAGANWNAARILEENETGHDGYVVTCSATGEMTATFASRLQPRRISRSALFFHNLESGNYGSFFFRQLPQMIIASRANLSFDCYIVGTRTEWFREALELLALPTLPIFRVDEVCGEIFSSISLYNAFDAEGFMLPEVTAGYHQIRDNVGISNNGPKRIYLSRALSGVGRQHYRHMTNEIAVEDFLSDNGFYIVYPETLSLREQIRAISNAEFIIGPSGSGMFNVAFARAGAKVVDIESYHNTVRQHAKFYSSQKIDYSFLFSEMDIADSSHPIFRRSTVPFPLLAQAVDWMRCIEMESAFSFSALNEIAVSSGTIGNSVSVDKPVAFRWTSEVDGSLVKEELFKAERVLLPELTLWRLAENSLLIGGLHLLVTGDHLVREQLVTGTIEQLSAYIGDVLTMRSIKDIESECFVVVREGAGTWGHWLGELLPKAAIVEKHHPGRFKFCVLSVYGDFEDGSRWAAIRDSLLAYGITRDRVVLIEDDGIYRFESLYALTPVWAHGMIHPLAADAMRSGLVGEVVDPDTTPDESDKLFLLRNPGDGRELSNQTEIETMLNHRGFKSVRIGMIPFYEQVRLFRAAKIVVGVLGSGFTGLLYAPPGVKVIALSPDNFGDSFFYGLAAEREGAFLEIRGPVVELDERYPHSSKFQISLTGLAMILDDLSA